MARKSSEVRIPTSVAMNVVTGQVFFFADCQSEIIGAEHQENDSIKKSSPRIAMSWRKCWEPRRLGFVGSSSLLCIRGIRLAPQDSLSIVELGILSSILPCTGKVNPACERNYANIEREVAGSEKSLDSQWNGGDLSFQVSFFGYPSAKEPRCTAF
jgi:hypothetical protein